MAVFIMPAGVGGSTAVPAGSPAAGGAGGLPASGAPAGVQAAAIKPVINSS